MFLKYLLEALFKCTFFNPTEKIDVNDSSNIQLYQEIKKNDHVIRETFLEKKNGKTEERRRR